ncbi:hypothetical protein B566_EDAN003374 [Ephemera danica]|nr:hypothetical protein B566_EDAN003374 [Ephemera danica]
MAPAFRLNLLELDARFRAMQAEVHPDRFVRAGETERRLSMQRATRANEAYQTLKKPLARAKYLLRLAGHDIQAENNTAMPADFLMAQMEWREAVMEAREFRNHHELEHLHNRLRADINARLDALGVLLDDVGDLGQAADLVRRLMFLEKLLIEIDDALASLED